MHELEQYFKNDQEWDDFADLFNVSWNESEEQIALLAKLKGNLDIAKVVYGKIGKNSEKVIEKQIPALDQKSILECLEKPNLVQRLKVCLMRMP